MTQENSEALKAQKKKDLEAYAIANLDGSIVDLAVAHYLDERSGYGLSARDAVARFLYGPAIDASVKFKDDNGKEGDLVRYALQKSRKEGQLYTGQISEMGLIQEAAQIVQSSISRLKVETAAQRLGYTKPIDNSYKGEYLSDLAEGNDQEKEFVKTFLGLYIGSVRDKGLAKALNLRADAITQGGLEELLKPEEQAA